MKNICKKLEIKIWQKVKSIRSKTAPLKRNDIVVNGQQ